MRFSLSYEVDLLKQKNQMKTIRQIKIHILYVQNTHIIE